MSNRPEALPTLAQTGGGRAGGAAAGSLLALALLLPCSSWSATVDGDVEEKRVREIEVQFPPFPKPENLIPFTVSATTDNKFMIDSESLAIGADEIVRFTLVIISPSGAENVSYEGMNCSTAERRLYALGRADRTWSKARSDRWIPIRENTLNRHYAELFTGYFCAVGIVLQDADHLRRALRDGGYQSNLRK
jgi:hypothetical protein